MKNNKENNAKDMALGCLTFIVIVILVAFGVYVYNSLKYDNSYESKKQQAQEAVVKFTEIQGSFSEILKAYQEECEGIANRSIDTTTAYSDLDRLEQQSIELFKDANALKVADQYEKGKDALVTGVTYLNSSLSKSKKYLDDYKVSNLSKAKGDLEEAVKCNNLASTLVSTRAVTDGYTAPQSNK